DLRRGGARRDCGRVPPAARSRASAAPRLERGDGRSASRTRRLRRRRVCELLCLAGGTPGVDPRVDDARRAVRGGTGAGPHPRVPVSPGAVRRLRGGLAGALARRGNGRPVRYGGRGSGARALAARRALPRREGRSGRKGGAGHTGGERGEALAFGGRGPGRPDAVAWALEAAGLGAGEILLTSWDRDGTRSGPDVELLRAVAGAVRVPVVASGGIGERAHVLEAFRAGADAVLAASVFHDGDDTVDGIKADLSLHGLRVRR